MDTKRNKNNISIPSNNILTLVLAQQCNFIHCSNISLLLINVQTLESMRMIMMMMMIIIITERDDNIKVEIKDVGVMV
jgi:hypothetical protein